MQNYEGAETNDQMYAKIKEINKRADIIAQRLPMLHNKDNDEMR